MGNSIELEIHNIAFLVKNRTDEFVSGIVVFKEKYGQRLCALNFSRYLIEYLKGTQIEELSDPPHGHRLFHQILSDRGLRIEKIEFDNINIADEFTAHALLRNGQETSLYKLAASDAIAFSIVTSCPLLMRSEIFERLHRGFKSMPFASNTPEEFQEGIADKAVTDPTKKIPEA